MQRRQFLAASLASSAAALTPSAIAASASDGAQATASRSREFYQIRRYQLTNGPQTTLTENYFSALLPALGRLGMGPVGAFKLEFGPQTPEFYLLIPGPSVEVLAELDLRLAQDSEFLEAAAPFWNAPATAPAFNRMEAALLAAFEGWPRITPPASSATKAKRIFQLRTYESPSHKDHIRKVQMFHSGEFEIFLNAGCHPVFFGDALIDTRLPKLTYMLGFADLAELTAKWENFSHDPAWKKLSSSPEYAYEAIVSNISNQILSPLAVSQI